MERTRSNQETGQAAKENTQTPESEASGPTELLSPRRKTIGEGLSGRGNSLNFLRLCLALMVIVAHAIALGFANTAGFHRTPPGDIAVFGFFGISGYLIAGSVVRNRPGRYLWQRFLRIFPGFWVALIVTALFFGVIGWLSPGTYAVPGFINHVHSECGTSCYLSARNSPFDYILANSFLKINQPFIAGTVWNGSLWTLFYEFLSYMFLLVLAIVGLVRHRIWTLATTFGLCLAVWIITFTPASQQITSPRDALVVNFLKLTPIFMVGAVIFLYRDRIPDSGWIALICSGLFFGGLWLPGAYPSLSFTDSGLLTPLIAYPLLWLGIHLPFQKVGARNDYSYGAYIYAFPVTVLLAIWNVQRWGYTVFILLCVAGTVPFAVASWWLIEKRALSLKKLEWRRVWAGLVGEPRPAK